MTPTDPNISIQQFGIVVGASIQLPDSLTGGALVALGARIQNNANVPEVVNVVMTYDCPLQAPVTIKQGQLTIPANSSAIYQTNWTPPGLGVLCTVDITATTVRTPVDSDSADWLILLTLGIGGTATSTSTETTEPTSPDINVQSFGVVVGVNITVLGELNIGALIPIGARIQNHSNVAEEVQVEFEYRFSLLGIIYGNWETIDQGTVTVPANSSSVFQRNWTPSGLLGFYQVRVTASTVRTPVDSDTETWAVIAVNP